MSDLIIRKYHLHTQHGIKRLLPLNGDPGGLFRGRAKKWRATIELTDGTLYSKSGGKELFIACQVIL